MRVTSLAGAAAVICLIGAGAFADVSNAAVQARMDAMKQMAGASRILGEMAKGQQTFDASKAAEAQSVIETASAQVPELFQSEETDPESEALPAIWKEWDRFEALSADLSAAASGMDASSLETVQAGVQQVGQACSACHRSYKE